MEIIKIILNIKLIILWNINFIVLMLPELVLAEQIFRVDPLALLAGTLRTYQRAGCDSEQLSLNCPRGTSISIELAQYGRAGDLSDNSLCPPMSAEQTTVGSDGIIHSNTEIEVKPSTICHWEQGLQYVLLQTVVEACQKKRACKFAATPKSTKGDPCPGVRKFVEIAYKCRPYEFRSKVACENDNMQLECNPYSRIAIYSASFGHTQHESVQCSQNPSHQRDEMKTCLASWATESVMQICHGRRRCSLSADSATFGNPCRSEVKMYLKVVYTCIPRKVLKDRYDTAAEPDEPQQTELDLDQDDLYDEDQFYKESEAIPPAPKLQGGLQTNQLNAGNHPLDFQFPEVTSSLMPPLLKRNDSLEENDLQNLNVNVSSSKSTTAPSNFISTDINSNKEFLNENQFIHKKNKKLIYNKKSYNEAYLNEINLNNILFSTTTENQFFVDYNINEEITEKQSKNNSIAIGFISNWLQTYIFIEKHQERFYLYLIISVTIGVLLCLTLVISRLILQKRRVRKNSSASSQNKSSSSIDGKFQKSTTGETQIPNGFSDDISEIDADIDLTTPLPVPTLSSRNENYMTYVPSSYNNMPPPSNINNQYSSSVTTMLMPQSGLVVTCGSSGSALNANRQQPTGSSNLIGGMSINTSMPGTLIQTPSGISSVSHHTAPIPSYLMMGHHGTLRRTMIPTSMGYIAAPSPPLPNCNPPPNCNTLGVSGLPIHHQPTVYFEGTLPRGNLTRGGSLGMPTSCISGPQIVTSQQQQPHHQQQHPSESQYFYG